jgi:NAD-dependent dihydropyrimidine dehydrogenase PreA subunit
LEVCSIDVYEMRDGKALPVHTEQCTGCESCVEVCKEQAISLEESTNELSHECSFLLRNII